MLFIVIIALCAFGGWAIGQNKQMGPGAGAVLGGLLGLIGLLIVACSKSVVVENPDTSV